LWTGGVLVLIIVLSVAGHRYYRGWQQRRLITQANAFFEKGDYKRASLSARRLIQINQNNADACRLMARLGEKASLRSAVDWRRHVVDLVGPQPDDLLALARSALQFDEIGSVEFALGKLPEQAKNSADYHAVAAELAAARQDAPAMEKHLIEAIRLAPDRKAYVLRLAVLRLRSPDLTANEQGRQDLIALQNDPAVGKDATRQLIEDSLRRYDFPGSTTLARQLLADPAATFRDRLIVLGALHQSSDPEFGVLLARLKQEAAGQPDKTGDLLTWLTSRRMVREAIDWSKTLPVEVTSKRPVPLALADAYIASADWDGLQRLVKTAAWGDLDYLRAALSARALRETGNQLDSQSQWNAAVKKANAKAEWVLTLAETAQRWGWTEEAIDLLWLAAKDPVKGEAALQMLYNHFAKHEDTQNVLRVLLHLEEMRPEDRNIRNNVAQISLLLNLNTDRAQRLARELYESEPGNAAYASTYAFALYTAGDSKKAVKILSGLRQDQLQQPAVAAYYGLALAAVGDSTKAAEFLDLGSRAKLLPEEKSLIDKARRSLPSS
jgi:tetratricopeptide (TPR) repeat protein